MKCVVTGAAGFIGSHLCERLLESGHEVTGIDCFVPYYPKPFKERNLTGLKPRPHFRFLSADLRTDSLAEATDGAEVIYHLAAMPGLEKSWTDFDGYQSCNVTATQRLLEAVRKSPSLKRFVYGSTSSVYGKFASGDETMPTRPVSPYGVTKLAGEHLAKAYLDTFGTPVVALRFFSVYGPRQRPDMAYNIFIRALLTGEPITIFGDGEQVRGNTFVLDCASAVMAAAEAKIGEIYNVGGGEAVSIREVLAKLERISGKRFTVNHQAARAGDQKSTLADTTKLRTELNWEPKTPLDAGLKAQFEWQANGG
ncbi:NAD-dependent epimerase/dehydratase family protein [Zavarzinella formosa]|uniref:NAD-dependent epimerase/dehydratase family protein n=1 Tax=Zavarzinella formosa TaxID=360055 RepID=UPI0002EB7073|nr:NAD-dependent epimerase/dehydratase family protein [Zavarzinella formosa]